MNKKLLEAVAIFKSLGWETATAENITSLPLGTEEEQKIALEGLKSGEWVEWYESLDEENGGTISHRKDYFDVDKLRLALFAIRLGVNVRRASELCWGVWRAEEELLVPVIAERGVKYATDFINHVCRSDKRMYEHSSTSYGRQVVQLVSKLNLDIPQNIEYLKDWSVYAALSMGLKAEANFGDKFPPSEMLDIIKPRFKEHIIAGVALNTPALGPFGEVLPEGVKRGWLSREKALELVFSALDSSPRPGDRRKWLSVLDELSVTNKELCARTQSLIPLLSLGDTVIISRLAPVLIAGSDKDLLTEILIASFSATTKKAKQIVIKSALKENPPENTDDLAPWLSILSKDKDKSIAQLAAKLIKEWKLTLDNSTEESEIQGLWQETPPVWQLPRFELGEVSPEALTDTAAKIVSHREIIHDVETERFLALTNALAYQNSEAARISLRGLRSGGRQLLCDIVCWVEKEKRVGGFDTDKRIYNPLSARDYMVALYLDKLPCLLSTPSFVDLSIITNDLVKRLELYKETNAEVLEADLFLALTRLDISTKTAENIKALESLNLPILLQSGKKMSMNVGKAVLNYIADPIKEPSFTLFGRGYWGIKRDFVIPNSMQIFPKRFNERISEHFSVFPLWGDAALDMVRWDDEVYHEQGLVLRQVARRAKPLPPGASINFLAAQRSMSPDAAEDSMRAVTEAWQRGLLRPGTSNVKYLDWSSYPPSNLVALVAALEGIARDGMLSVVWPILDELILSSLKAPRLIVGTAEIAALMETFLPEVKNAVDKGLADKTALDLPGLRLLAERGGSSRAVSTAQNIVKNIPHIETISNTEEISSTEISTTIEDIWKNIKNPSGIEDGVTLSIDWANPNDKQKLFLFTLTLPEISDRVFQVVIKWYYGLEEEAQCEAYAVAPGANIFLGNDKNEVWLHWDVEQKTMAVCDMRNWKENKDGPLSLSKSKRPPMPNSFFTIIIGLLAQDGDAVHSAPSALRKFIGEGKIGEDIVRKATKTLLQYTVVSPAKLVRLLEKDIKLLPVLWPMLTESIKLAGEKVTDGDAPPVWVNRILDVTLRYAPYLKEAENRGLIYGEDAQWIGLSEIASSKSKSTAVGKAKKLLATLK